PTAHLLAQTGDRLAFDPQAGCLIPPSGDGPMRPAGAARGALRLGDCISDGKAQAHRAMGELGLHRPMSLPLAPVTPQPQNLPPRPGKGFVDLQNDVTAADVAQAAREGYGDIELAKRYTTLGMGTDQGKTSWTNGILTLAEATGQSPQDIGHTTYRPPYSPVTIGALVGTETGRAMTPTRRTPFHRVFKAAGCVFQTSGDWLYARYFPQTGEDMAKAVLREVRAVRGGLGCVDMSTLGKFEITGPDTRSFLSRLYCNGLANLRPGRLRYALMLREDGIVFDDGVVAMLAEDRFLVTATTARSASVWRHMQRLSQIDWPDLDVTLTEVSDHWAALAIAGPEARNLLTALAPDFAPDFTTDRAAFPFACVREGRLGGDLPVRVFSVSYSGELSYEINTQAGFAEELWRRVIREGARWGITPYGIEALDVLRIEKGHLSVGTEIDGRRTPDDLGLGGMVAAKKDFIGRALLARPALQATGRPQLIGLRPADGITPIPLASHLTDRPLGGDTPPTPRGHLTAAVQSPTLGHPIALGFLADGRARIGERLWAVSPIAAASVEVEVTAPCAYDPDGGRLHG
ncbi:MAG: glycine cleavage T C-terminal barrel domain-containing protein, partial [Albidovulum sp.]|uniref:glycine cleavage T C-terminal barrel domain-containing protein n=1 Tax=Albidovulum sp. TaxID=1872424 RepID=UPI003CA7332E